MTKIPMALPGKYPRTLWQRICWKLTGHRFKRPTSEWAEDGFWYRHEECRICGRGWIRWQTYPPETGEAR